MQSFQAKSTAFQTDVHIQAILQAPTFSACGPERWIFIGTRTWNPYLEPRKLPKPSLGTCTWNLGTSWNLYAETFFWNFGTFWNLTFTWTSGTFTWNSYLEPWNLLKTLLATLEPPGSFTWNPSLKPGNLLKSWLGTPTWNLGTSRNLHLQPLDAWNLHFKPSTWNLRLKPFAWNFGTSWILYFEPRRQRQWRMLRLRPPSVLSLRLGRSWMRPTRCWREPPWRRSPRKIHYFAFMLFVPSSLAFVVQVVLLSKQLMWKELELVNGGCWTQVQRMLCVGKGRKRIRHGTKRWLWRWLEEVKLQWPWVVRASWCMRMLTQNRFCRLGGWWESLGAVCLGRKIEELEDSVSSMAIWGRSMQETTNVMEMVWIEKLVDEHPVFGSLPQVIRCGLKEIPARDLEGLAKMGINRRFRKRWLREGVTVHLHAGPNEGFTLARALQ